MGLKLRTKPEDLEIRISGVIQKFIERKIKTLIEAGYILQTEVYRSGNYQNRTGDLRNSIGFVVTYNGEVRGEYFQENVGGSIAKKKAYKQAKRRKGIVLIVVAGMNYAVYVEAKGFNVLTSAKQLANTMLPKLLK